MKKQLKNKLSQISKDEIEKILVDELYLHPDDDGWSEVGGISAAAQVIMDKIQAAPI